MSKKNILNGHMVFTFKDGSKSTLPLDDYLLQIHNQAAAMAQSDDDFLRYSGKQRINQFFEASLHGIKAQDQRIKAGFSSGKERLPERQKAWDTWQAEADKLWDVNPRLSKLEVAKRIKQHTDASIESIRKRIKNPHKNK